MKADLRNWCLIGTLTSALQPVYVDRFSREGKNSAVDEIEIRATNREYPPLLIFPEGTNHNQKTLTAFKKGAFAPGQPVQPVIIKVLISVCPVCFTALSIRI